MGVTQLAHQAIGLPARAAQLDLTGRGAVFASAGAMTLVSAIDLIDGRLGPILSAGFVIVALTIGLAVDRRDLLTAALLPPLLLLVTFMVIALIDPRSIDVPGMAPDINWVGRAISGVVDRGVALIVGYGLALAVIALRIASMTTDGMGNALRHRYASRRRGE